jgi:hypothetical protein
MPGCGDGLEVHPFREAIVEYCVLRGLSVRVLTVEYLGELGATFWTPPGFTSRQTMDGRLNLNHQIKTAGSMSGFVGKLAPFLVVGAELPIERFRV